MPLVCFLFLSLPLLLSYSLLPFPLFLFPSLLFSISPHMDCMRLLPFLSFFSSLFFASLPFSSLSFHLSFISSLSFDLFHLSFISSFHLFLSSLAFLSSFRFSFLPFSPSFLSFLSHFLSHFISHFLSLFPFSFSFSSFLFLSPSSFYSKTRSK